MMDHEVGAGVKTPSIHGYCKSNGCLKRVMGPADPYHCTRHSAELTSLIHKHKDNSALVNEFFGGETLLGVSTPKAESMSAKYPKYYKPVGNLKEVDVYAVCKLFPVVDDTGCINHARKKLLVPGTRTGGKSFRDDIKEARDTLTRWLELNPE